MNRVSLIASLSCALLLAGCKRESADQPSKAPSAPSAPTESAVDDHGHSHADGEDHATEPPAGGAGHGGEIIQLGTTKAGELTVRASRDVGEIKAGGDAPIDVWVTTADGTPATVKAVRFWIGTEDAKGSIKAKADIEIPEEPNHWHTHAEVPVSIPDGAKLWVQIETTDGEKRTVSFDLRA